MNEPSQSVNDQCSDTGELMTRLKNLGVTLRCTCTAAPVQFEGELDGLHLYFRARWNSWDLAIAPTLNEAVRETNLAYYKESDYGEERFEASWMSHKEALAFILECVQEFKRREAITHDLD
jgi:hypothetical protein